jgi:hypothetical protein
MNHDEATADVGHGPLNISKEALERRAEMVFDTAHINQGIDMTQVGSAAQDPTHDGKVVSLGIIETRRINEAEPDSWTINATNFHDFDFIFFKCYKFGIFFPSDLPTRIVDELEGAEPD